MALYQRGHASEPIRLQNLADNTAHSMADLVTREIKRLAVTNRAIAANQIAANQVMIGQPLAMACIAPFIFDPRRTYETYTLI